MFLYNSGISKRLVTGLSPQKPAFDRRLSYVRFVVDKVALGRATPQVIPISPFITVPPALHCDLHLHVALTRTTKGGPRKPSKKQFPLGNRERCVAKYIHLFRDSEVQTIVLLNLPSSFYRLNPFKPTPVAARSKAWVCDCSLAGIAGSSPAWGFDVCLL